MRILSEDAPFGVEGRFVLHWTGNEYHSYVYRVTLRYRDVQGCLHRRSYPAEIAYLDHHSVTISARVPGLPCYTSVRYRWRLVLASKSRTLDDLYEHVVETKHCDFLVKSKLNAQTVDHLIHDGQVKLTLWLHHPTYGPRKMGVEYREKHTPEVLLAKTSKKGHGWWRSELMLHRNLNEFIWRMGEYHSSKRLWNEKLGSQGAAYVCRSDPLDAVPSKTLEDANGEESGRGSHKGHSTDVDSFDSGTPLDNFFTSISRRQAEVGSDYDGGGGWILLPKNTEGKSNQTWRHLALKKEAVLVIAFWGYPYVMAYQGDLRYIQQLNEMLEKEVSEDLHFWRKCTPPMTWDEERALRFPNVFQDPRPYVAEYEQRQRSYQERRDRAKALWEARRVKNFAQGQTGSSMRNVGTWLPSMALVGNQANSDQARQEGTPMGSSRDR